MPKLISESTPTRNHTLETHAVETVLPDPLSRNSHQRNQPRVDPSCPIRADRTRRGRPPGSVSPPTRSDGTGPNLLGLTCVSCMVLCVRVCVQRSRHRRSPAPNLVREVPDIEGSVCESGHSRIGSSKNATNKGAAQVRHRFGDRAPEEGLEPDRSARPDPRNLQPTKGW